MRCYNNKELLKVHLIDKSLSLWLVTTEVLVELHRVLVTTALKHLIAELVGNLLREDTLLLEVRVGICCKNLCPLIAILASSVTTAEDVGKGRTHSGILYYRHNLGWSQCCTLELKDIALVRGSQ